MRVMDKMFDHSVNKSDRTDKVNELIKKYEPKPIRTYKENGNTITVYESRHV